MKVAESPPLQTFRLSACRPAPLLQAGFVSLERSCWCPTKTTGAHSMFFYTVSPQCFPWYDWLIDWCCWFIWTTCVLLRGMMHVQDLIRDGAWRSYPVSSQLAIVTCCLNMSKCLEETIKTTIRKVTRLYQWMVLRSHFMGRNLRNTGDGAKLSATLQLWGFMSQCFAVFPCAVGYKMQTWGIQSRKRLGFHPSWPGTFPLTSSR
jgi:hypothetical protein